MERLDLAPNDACAALDISRRTYYRYGTPGEKIPRVVELAIKWLEHERQHKATRPKAGRSEPLVLHPHKGLPSEHRPGPIKAKHHPKPWDKARSVG